MIWHGDADAVRAWRSDRVPYSRAICASTANDQEERLPIANGIMEMVTYLGILIGTIAAGYFTSELLHPGTFRCSVI